MIKRFLLTVTVIIISSIALFFYDTEEVTTTFFISFLKGLTVNNLSSTQGIHLLYGTIFLLLLGILFSSKLLGSIGLLFFIFVAFFFRNPDRVCIAAQGRSDVLICPADGKIIAIEALENDVHFSHKIAIFLSPLDVHVQWCPVDGIVEEVHYHKGEFAMAFLPKSSVLNERNDVMVTMANGKKIKVRQIAGTIARTIVCWVQEKQELRAGQKFGMIKFGSRVELFVPASVKINVVEGQRVYGGKTAVGEWVNGI